MDISPFLAKQQRFVNLQSNKQLTRIIIINIIGTRTNVSKNKRSSDGDLLFSNISGNVNGSLCPALLLNTILRLQH
jgi:hypothetical protein